MGRPGGCRAALRGYHDCGLSVMRPTLLTLVLVALAAASFAAPRKGQGGKIEWGRDLKLALERAQKQQRPLMLYFTHDC